MTTKKILLIDQDGVICDYYGQFLKMWKEQHPEKKFLEAKDLNTFYIEDHYGSENLDHIFAITRSKFFFETLPPITGAIEALKQIEADGEFEPFIVTAPDLDFIDQGCWSEKARYIKHHLGEYWLKRLIITKDKTLVKGNWIIDDKPEMKGINTNPDWTQIFFEHGYNKHLPGLRLKTWAHWPELKKQLLVD